MFGRFLKCELKRSCSPAKSAAVMILFVISVFFSIWEILGAYIGMSYNERMSYGSVIYFLDYMMVMGALKVICVLLLSMLHTGSFCDDFGHHYLRAILNRVDVATYTQCRFVGNALAIVVTSTGAICLFTAIMRLFFPVSASEVFTSSYYYVDMIVNEPYLYIVLTGIEFGIVAAACSSIGLLFSVWQTNRFVSVGLPALCFYLGFSYIPSGTFFSLQDLIMMRKSFPANWEIPVGVNLAWGILYPVLVIAACGFLFYRTLKRRMLNGSV